MKLALTWFLMAFFVLLAICAIRFNNETPEQKFISVSKHYSSSDLQIVKTLSPQLRDATILRKFSPQNDGNVVVLIERYEKETVQVWASDVVADVIINSKAHKKQYENRTTD